MDCRKNSHQKAESVGPSGESLVDKVCQWKCSIYPYTLTQIILLVFQTVSIFVTKVQVLQPIVSFYVIIIWIFAKYDSFYFDFIMLFPAKEFSCILNCLFLFAINKMKITSKSTLKLQIKNKIGIEIFFEAMECFVRRLNYCLIQRIRTVCTYCSVSWEPVSWNSLWYEIFIQHLL